MKQLSPSDIASREFARSLRGYDPEEVHEFLGRVSDEVYALQKRITELSKLKAAGETRPETPDNAGKPVVEAPDLSEDELNAARAQIEQEREQMRREAQAEAEELKFAAQHEVSDMREELRGLKMQRDAYVKRFRFLIKSQVELLDLLENETSDTADARVESPA